MVNFDTDWDVDGVKGPDDYDVPDCKCKCCRTEGLAPQDKTCKYWGWTYETP